MAKREIKEATKKQMELLWSMGLQKFEHETYKTFYLNVLDIETCSYYIEEAKQRRGVVPYSEFKKNKAIFDDVDGFMKTVARTEKEIYQEKRQEEMNYYKGIARQYLMVGDNIGMKILILQVKDAFKMNEEDVKNIFREIKKEVEYEISKTK